MSEDRIDAKTAALYLRDVTPTWRSFWLHMHLMAKSLREFSVGLGAISDDVFAYHVSGEKNDFARWSREVIGDAVLARALDGVQTKEDAARIVQGRVAELEAAAAS